eukprot:11278152-Alexandrium_andersonii.AAC.1
MNWHRCAGCLSLRPVWACKGRVLRYWTPDAQLSNSDRAQTRAWLETRQRLSARAILRAVSIMWTPASTAAAC